MKIFSGLVAAILLSDVVQSEKPSIFCVIYTTGSAHGTRFMGNIPGEIDGDMKWVVRSLFVDFWQNLVRVQLATVLQTWAKKCDDKLIFTDKPLDSDIPHVYFPFMTTRDHSWEKVRRVFRYIYEMFGKQYDWYLRADDDSYVIMENARTLAAQFNPQSPQILGFRWGFFEPRGFIDGGVYIVSHEALNVFNQIMRNDSICPDFHRAEEDQEFGRCMARAGIYPADTRDSLGRERFHHFHVDEFDDNKVVDFVRQFPEGISDTSVSFHHVSPYEIQVIDYFVGRLKIKNPIKSYISKKRQRSLMNLITGSG